MLKIDYLPVAQLVPSVHNSNTHPPDQIKSIAASIRQFGFLSPILVAGKQIIAGEGRYLAAVQLKLKKVPTINVDNLSEAQQRAYIIADNRIAQGSFWNEQKLAEEVSALLAMDFSIEGLGFNSEEINRILEDATAATFVNVSPHKRTIKKTVESMKAPKEKPRLAVLVFVEDENERAALLDELTSRDYDCKEFRI